MLKIYNPHNPADVIPLPLDDRDRYVTHKYDGNDTLTFEMASNDPLYKYVTEEAKVEDEKNRYVIKKIDEHSDFATVICYIDLDDWKAAVFNYFRTTNKMLSDVMAMLLPDGWRVEGADAFSKRTTVEETEGQAFVGANAAKILPYVAKAYSCTFQFDVPRKIITAVDPTTFLPSGNFFTDELNLKNLGFVGNSVDFATRLYAFGAKDESTGEQMTFADVNDGKPYVEDYSYSDKVISIGWSDERYTNKESLLAAAKAKLAEVSWPNRSYTCTAEKLGEGTWLYQVVTLIDRKRKTRINHQIVEYKEYPNHVGDSVTLSKIAPEIGSYVDKLSSELKQQLDKQSATMQGIIQDAVEHATGAITGNKGGHFLWMFDGDGKPTELLNLCDTDDINTAKKVWRWNASGLGHSNDGYNGLYTLALLDDGSINASAITTGKLTANIIKAGVLSDVVGNTRWDLENGVLSSKKLSIDSPNFKLDEGGNVACKSAKLEDVIATGKFTTYDPNKKGYLEFSGGALTGYYDGSVAGDIYFEPVSSGASMCGLQISSKYDTYLNVAGDLIFHAVGDIMVYEQLSSAGGALYTGATSSIVVNGYTLEFVKGLLVAVY